MPAAPAVSAFTSTRTRAIRASRCISIERGEADCKFWLYPEIRLAYNHGFNAREVKQLTEAVEARRTDIERVWNEHFT